jgi:hypothetical protein
MANALYGPGREGFLAGEIDWDTAVIKLALVRGSFLSTQKFVSDLTTAGGVLDATSGALGTKTITNGTADAADVTCSAVAYNATGHSVVIFQASAVTGGADVAATAQRLICWLDTGTNFPIYTNGGDVVLTWDSGANKIFTL